MWIEKETALENHYGDALWKGDFNFPDELDDKVVVTCDDVIRGMRGECGLIISAIAPRLGKLESDLRDAGFIVVSISPYERQRNPLCVLEANAEVLKTALMSSKGAPPLIKSPNCVCCGTSVVLAALAAAFGDLEQVSVTTFQSLSGRGDAKYPAEKVVNNVYPLHGTAEATEALIKEELETVMGRRAKCVSVTAYRVSVQRGHLVDVRVKFAKKMQLESPEQVYKMLESFDPLDSIRALLPSIKAKPIVCAREGGFPRPATSFAGGLSKGFSVTVGNIKINDGPFDVCLSLVVDNLVKGALGAGLQLLEYSTAILDNASRNGKVPRSIAAPGDAVVSTHCAECRSSAIDLERIDYACPQLRFCAKCWARSDAVENLLEASVVHPYAN